MVTLTPVETDPFASGQAAPSDWSQVPRSEGGRPQITINAKPQAAPKLTEVDFDPFASTGKSMGDRAYGLYKAADAGAARGLSGLVGMLGDVTDAGANALGYATNFVESQLGLPETPAPDRSKSILNKIPTSASVSQSIQEGVYGGEKPYEPQGAAEDYARSIGEFIPAALAMPGGIAARVAQTVIPGVTSETAGRLTKGTAAEPYARAGGALLGSAGASFLTRPGTASRAIREQLPNGVTPEMVTQAEALMQRAAQQGVTLSWPEALSQSAGRPVLSNVARHLEAAPQTEARMAEFYGRRPQQIETAGRGAIDNIAPANNAPSTIGPRASETAQSTLRDVERARSNATRPLYDAAKSDHVPHPVVQEFISNLDDAIARDKTGIVGDRLSEIRRLLVEKPAQPAVPAVRTARETPNGKIYDTTPGKAAVPETLITDIENLDRVRKYVRDKVEMPQIGQDAITKEQGASIMRAVDDLKKRMLDSSPSFAQGKQLHQDITTKYVKPIFEGPLGKLAEKDITTKRAVEALFPANPLANSTDEISTTVGALAKRSPRIAGDLVRAHVEGVFNEATQALQSGANQAGGAKFAAVLMGNPQQRANLEAAITALPNGAERLAGFNRFLEVAQATGTRQGIGSRTAYNAEMLKNQSASGLVGEGAKAAANPLKGVQFLADRYERWRLGQNLDQLASILTSPQSGNQLRAIARMAPGSRQAGEVALRVISSINTGRGLKPVEKTSQ